MERFLTIEQAMQALNVSRRSVYRPIKSGRLPAVDLFAHQAGHRRKALWRIPAEAVEALKKEAYQKAS